MTEHPNVELTRRGYALLGLAGVLVGALITGGFSFWSRGGRNVPTRPLRASATTWRSGARHA